MELKDLYQEIILDHAKNPRNKGKCSEYNHDAKAHNPLCGDKVHIYLKLEKDKNISKLSFEGEGCAISLASASILTDTLKGKDLNFSKKVTQAACLRMSDILASCLDPLKFTNTFRSSLYLKSYAHQLNHG